jgi:hypothetical protein
VKLVKNRLGILKNRVDFQKSRGEKSASKVDKRGLGVGLCRLGKMGKEKKV